DQVCVKANFNPAFLQPQQPVRRYRPIVVPEPARLAPMRVQHFDVKFRAMEINRVVDHGRRFSTGKGALGIWHCPAANRFPSTTREQQPWLLGAANETANLTDKLPLAILPPAAAMTAPQRQKLPHQTKLLVELRQLLRLRSLPLQRRMPRHKLH